MPIEKIPGAAPPGRTGLPEKEGRNQKELTPADIRQVSRAITEEYIDQLRTLAYEDAKTGACRQGGQRCWTRTGKIFPVSIDAMAHGRPFLPMRKHSSIGNLTGFI